jgi:uncharacterized DUF497 family protein
MNYVWYEKKNKQNLRKHGIRFEFAIHTFDDPLRIEGYDEDHSSDEDRLYIIGEVTQGRPMYVVYKEIDDETIRIISARKANGLEKRRYYERS